MKRTIVTGATGFVGANLARRLLLEGNEVFALVSPQHKSWRLECISNNICFHTVNLHDSDNVQKAVSEIKPDWIFHLAAYGTSSHQTDTRRIVDTNFVGTVNLVEACLKTGFESFVNTGSSSEYGIKNHAPEESEWLEPNSHYAVAKAAATLYCRFTARNKDVHLSTLRLYSVYGPFEEPTRLMPTIIIKGLNGELPTLVSPDLAHDFVYVEDVCDAYLKAAALHGSEKGAIYNVGSGEQTTLQSLVKLARKILNISVEPQWGTMPDRYWDTKTWIANIGKISRELAWSPSFSLEKGFCAMVDWFKNNPPIKKYYQERIFT